MQCPKCSSDMEKVTYESIEVDRCLGCKGIWFDMLEAEHLKAIAGSESIDVGDDALGKEQDEARQVDCPTCKGPMIKMVDRGQPHIHYEACTVCHGLFFDAGEFRDFKEQSVLEFFGDLFGRRRS